MRLTNNLALSVLFFLLWAWPLYQAIHPLDAHSEVFRIQLEDIRSYEMLNGGAEGLAEVLLFKAPSDPTKGRIRRLGAGQQQRAQFAFAPLIVDEVSNLERIRRRALQYRDFGVLVWPSDSERIDEVREALRAASANDDRRLVETSNIHAVLLRLRPPR